MSITSIQSIYPLIKSLTKAEKRHFKIYSHRNSSNESIKFVQLFDSIDNLNMPDDSLTMQKMDITNKIQYTNLKRHLYGELLKSLRLFHSKHNEDIWIREQLDYAKILYGKGFFMQALKILEKASKLAQNNNADLLHLEVIEFSKLIESRHITRSRSVVHKIEDIIDSSNAIIETFNNKSRLLNASLQIHGYFIKNGHCKNENDISKLNKYFDRVMSSVEKKPASFFESIYYNQCYMWKYFISLNTKRCYHHAARWVALFEDDPKMKSYDPDLYMRGLHYAMHGSRNLGRVSEFNHCLSLLKAFYSVKSESFNETSNIIYFIYGYNALLNEQLLNGINSQVDALIIEINDRIQSYKSVIDSHRISTFYYKIIRIYFVKDDHLLALNYCDKILENLKGNLRVQTIMYTKFIQLVCNFEINNYPLCTTLAMNMLRIIKKNDPSNKILTIITQFIEQASQQKLTLEVRDWQSLDNQLSQYVNDPFKMRLKVYFDYEIWIESKLKSTSLSKLFQLKVNQQIV